MHIPATLDRSSTAAVPHGSLSESLISGAVECGHDSRPGWKQRHDGWTPDRIRAFLTALAQTGVVSDAARAAGMSKQSAYAFRNSARGRAFDVAWRAAHMLSRKQIADELISRALNGCVEKIVRGGEVVAERHRHDNRLAMSVLTRLDTLAASPAYAEEAVACAAEEFDEFLDEVCAGGESAARFLAVRLAMDEAGHAEPAIIARSEEYLRSGSGTGWEDDGAAVADLDATVEESTAPEPPVASSSSPDPSIPRRKKAAPPPAHPVHAPRRGRNGRWDHGSEPPSDDLSYLSDEELDAQFIAHVVEAIDFEAMGIDPSALRLRDSAFVSVAARNQWQPSTSATLQSSPSLLGEGDQPQAGGGASGDGGSGPAIGEAGEAMAPTPDPQSPDAIAAAAAIPSPQPPSSDPLQAEQWVLGDDGLPVKTVNGRLPPHHLRRRPYQGDW